VSITDFSEGKVAMGWGALGGAVASIVLIVGAFVSLSIKTEANQDRIDVLESRLDVMQSLLSEQSTDIKLIQSSLAREFRDIHYKLDRHKDIIDNSNNQRRRFQQKDQ